MHTQDRTVAVWDMRGPKDIVLHHVLANYGMENAVDFDDRYIVSGSGGNIIRVSTGNNLKAFRTTLV